MRARRRDRVRLAVVLDLPAPGGAHRRPRGPRAAGRRLRARPRRDAHRDHRGDPARLRQQPEQPHRHASAGTPDRGVPGARCPPCDRRCSTRPTSSSRPTTTRTRPSTCSAVSRTVSSCGRSARSTASPACAAATRSARPTFRAAVDAVRQPFSVNELAQVAAAEAILHSDDVLGRVERTTVERVFVEEGCSELGLDPPASQANFSWIHLGDDDEPEVIQGLGERGIVVAAGHQPRWTGPHPGHVRHTGRERALPRGARRPSALSAGCWTFPPHLLKTSANEPREHSACVTAPRARGRVRGFYYWRFS